MRACTHRTSANGAASRRTSLEFVALGSSTDDPKIPTSVLREHAIHQGIIRNVGVLHAFLSPAGEGDALVGLACMRAAMQTQEYRGGDEAGDYKTRQVIRKVILNGWIDEHIMLESVLLRQATKQEEG